MLTALTIMAAIVFVGWLAFTRSGRSMAQVLILIGIFGGFGVGILWAIATS